MSALGIPTSWYKYKHTQWLHVFSPLHTAQDFIINPYCWWKAPSLFIRYVQFSVIARKLNTPVSLCSRWGPSRYDKRGETLFSPMLWIYLTHTNTHGRAHTFQFAAISASLPHYTLIFFPSLWMLGRNNRNNNMDFTIALLHAILFYLVDDCFA